MGKTVCRETRYFAWPYDLLPIAKGGIRYDTVMSDREIAALLGVERKTVARWRKDGMDYWAADLLATRVLGQHPEAVWANWRYRTTLALRMEEVVA